MDGQKLVIIGFCNMDINRYPDGREEVQAGGAAYFAALAASFRTSPVGLVTRIGSDFDDRLLRERLLPEGLHKIKDKKASKSIQTFLSKTDPTRREVELFDGVAQDLCIADIPSLWLQSATHIHVGTMPPAHQYTFIRFLKEQKIKAVISTDVELSFLKNEKLLPQIVRNVQSCDLVFVNRKEYALLKNDLHIVPEVVVKKDKDGAMLLRFGKETETVSAVEVRAVDTTGAGDVFAGAYLAEQSKKTSVKESLQIAADLATTSIKEKGIEHLFV